MILILHQVRSMENVGSIFRTADAMGVSRIYLVGYTPAPLDRFNRPVTRLAKAALGAEKTVPWERVSDVVTLIEKLKRDGITVIALEQDDRAAEIKTFSPHGQVALVVGNEVEGVPNEVLDRSDVIVEIGMHGMKESLNVAVATGIALHHLAQIPN